MISWSLLSCALLYIMCYRSASCFCSDKEIIIVTSSPEVVEIPPPSPEVVEVSPPPH